MGRLRNFRFYGCGPIDRVSNNDASNWRIDMGIWLKKRGAIFIDPLNKPCSIGLESDDARQRRVILKKEKNFSELANIMRKIRNVDLRFCDISDAIICYLPLGASVFGTVEELITSNRQKKPLLLVCNEGIENIPDWAFSLGDINTMFGSFDDLKSYLTLVDESPSIEGLCSSRWLFLDQSFLAGN